MLPIGQAVQGKVRDNLQSVATERKDVDLVCAVQTVSGAVGETLEIENKVRVCTMGPGSEGEGEEVEVGDGVDDKLSQLLPQNSNGDEAGSVGTKATHTLTGESLFVVRQPQGTSVGWRVRDDEETDDTLADSDGSRYDEKPLPSGDSMDAIHVLVKSCLQSPQEHGTGDVRDGEEGESDR